MAVLLGPSVSSGDQEEPTHAIVEEPGRRNGRENPRPLTRASSEIGIDGILDEPAWAQALRFDLPYEVWPSDNVEALVRTEALLTYDSSRVYAAFKAHDPEPEKIRARLSDRDNAFSDDFVGIVVDTFNDGRRGFEFFVNPVGVQMDLTQDDVSDNEDSTWDAIWHSAGRVTEDGYVVEMAIPYTSLRFQRQDGPQIWGLDLIRVYPRDKRYILASNYRDKNVNCYLCQVGRISGFDGATPGKNIEITPTMTTIRTDEAPNQRVDPGDPSNTDLRRFSSRSLERGDAELDPGITAKWGMTPNLTLSGAINPDFSQVEADAAQLDVNERFELFFPEKRPFFMEGADFFETPFDAVHTRTVDDPKWGAKLTGKEGKHAIGAFVAEDERTLLVFPGSQGSDDTFFEQSVTDGVLRYRRDVGKSSAVGGLLTFREGNGNEYFNHVIGADALLRASEKDTFRIQLLGSETRYPDEHPDDPNGTLITEPLDPNDTRSSFGQPGGTFSDAAYYLNYAHGTKTWSIWALHQQKGSQFRGDLGFIPEVDTRFSLASYEYGWWGEEGKTWWSRIWLGGDVDETVDLDGNLIERELETRISYSGPMQSFFFLGGGNRRFEFRDDRFAQPFVNFTYEFRPVGDLFVGLSSGVSKRVDFSFVDPNDPGAARQGDEFRSQPAVTWHLGSRLRTGLSHLLRQLRNDEGRLFRANLTQLNTTFQLNIRTFFRAILQYRDVDLDTSLYPDCLDEPQGTPTDCGLEERTKSFFTQLLFSYKVNPQTALFLGYTESQPGGSDAVLAATTAEDDDLPLTRQDRTLFFKIGYAFVQ